MGWVHFVSDKRLLLLYLQMQRMMRWMKQCLCLMTHFYFKLFYFSLLCINFSLHLLHALYHNRNKLGIVYGFEVNRFRFRGLFQISLSINVRFFSCGFQRGFKFCVFYKVGQYFFYILCNKTIMCALW